MQNAATVTKIETKKPRTRKASKPRSRSAKKTRTLTKMENALTVALGTGVPALSLAMSGVAGAMSIAGQGVLSMAAAFLVVCVLAVSLTHVADAIQEVTGSKRWLAWSLAVAVDASLIVCEVSLVTTDVA